MKAIVRHRGIRITLAVIETFIGLSAIGGGIAILTGAFAQWLPTEWLQSTPFRDYTIIGLILTIVVGGGMLLAAGMVFIQREWAVLLSATTGGLPLDHRISPSTKALGILIFGTDFPPDADPKILPYCSIH